MASDQEKMIVELFVELEQTRRENMLLVALVARLAKVNAAWQTSSFSSQSKPWITIDTPEGPVAWEVPGWAQDLFAHRYYQGAPRKTVSPQSSETRCEIIKSLVDNIDRIFEQSEKMKR